MWYIIYSYQGRREIQIYVRKLNYILNLVNGSTIFQWIPVWKDTYPMVIRGDR